MARVSKARLDPRLYLQYIIPLHRVEIFEAGLRIFRCIERCDPSPALPLILPALPFRIHFLDVSRIQKHDLAQFRGGRRGDNPALESVMNQLGNLSAVVDMGVGQKQGVDALWIKSPGIPVSTFHLFSALKKTAVHKDLFPFRAFNEITGTGYGTGAAKAGYSDHILLLYGLERSVKTNCMNERIRYINII